LGAPSTQSESHYEAGGDAATPGALLVFSVNTPMLRPIAVDGTVVIGRESAGGTVLPDEKVSRRHVELSRDASGWRVKDLGSRNGVSLNGEKIAGEARAASGDVVRIAQTLLLLYDDISRFRAATVSTDGQVIGPTLKAAHQLIALAASAGSSVLITGENGTGKEHAARVFHEAAGLKGSPYAVNCANVQSTLAERQFFGAVKGAATDIKADVIGFVQAADGGSLFLDELGEMNLEVQAKLLRVIETGEVLPLGATAPKKVTVRYCAATNRNLREAIAAGAFRQDLFYRLAQAEVRLPALRERRADIPWLVAHALAEQPVRVPHVSLVEAALRRAWPGNVRELISAVRRAAQQAQLVGGNSVRAEHLGEESGMAHAPASTPPETPSSKPTKEQLQALLEKHRGNVSAVARELGEHRTQLNRWLKQYGLKSEAEA